jgi:acyl-CoA thioesterase-1
MKRWFCYLLFSYFMFSPLTAEDSQRVVVLGDSLTAGYGLDPDLAFPALLQAMVDESGLNFEIVNAGVSGDTSAGGVRRINWLLKQKIDVLILELGANDGLRGVSLESTRTNLQKIIDETKTKNPEVDIIIAGMMVPPNLGPDYTERFKQIFPSLAENNNCFLIPFLLDGVAGQPELNLPDGIHPTAEGHQIIAENVWKILEPVLRERDKR